MSIEKIAFKAPPFNTTDPELWFILLEVSFATAGISQEATKYLHTVSALDPSTTNEMRDVLFAPRGPEPYTQFKAELIKRLSVSTERRMKKLLEGEELGDRTPSQFLRHLRSLGGNASDDILRSLWMFRLPQAAQVVVAAQKDLPIDKLAGIADSVVEALQGGNPPTSRPSAADFQEYGTALATLTREVAALRLENHELRQRPQCAGQHRDRSRSFDRRRSNGRRERSHSRGRLCYYHSRFADKAINCSPPCSFRKAGNGIADQ